MSQLAHRSADRLDEAVETGAGALPNLLIIGAPKAGTTSLHHYLHQHPEIFMSPRKELNFFTFPEPPESLDDYKRHFLPSAAVRGEASPSYSQHPRFTGVPERISAVLPDVKLIYVVRDPVERLVSQWADRYSLGLEQRSFHEALRDQVDLESIYVCPSRYATQIERYLDSFPASNLLIVDQSEFLRNRRETLRRLFGFLSVQEDFWSPTFEQRLNTQKDHRRITERGRRLRRSAAWTAARRLPTGLRAPMARQLRRLLSRKVEREALDPELRARLNELLKDEADRFRALAGRPFSHWSI